MSFEYKVIADKKVSFTDLELICNTLKEYPLFCGAILTEYGIHIPCEEEENIGWEMVNISLIDEGLFIVVNMNRKETDILFEIIQNIMCNKEIKIIIEDA